MNILLFTNKARCVAAVEAVEVAADAAVDAVADAAVDVAAEAVDAAVPV